MFAGIESGAVFAWFLGIGVVITIIMAIVNWNLYEETFEIDARHAKVCKIGKFEFRPKVIWKCTKIVLLHVFTMFSIATIGGIVDAMWAAPLWRNVMWEDISTILDYFLLGLGLIIIIGLPMALTYLVGFLVIGLTRYTKKYSHVIFFMTFIVSFFFWCNYINTYEAKIETTTELVETTQERELLMFYEIPVQQVSGSVSGSSFIGSGSVSGSIFTTDTVPYVYLNEAGNGKWDSAPAADSEIVFITEEGGAPKIVIVTYTEKTIRIDHNVEQKSVTDEKSWTKYYFYLPKSVIQSIETE